MTFVTCDLCDENADSVSVVTGHNWFSYGGRSAFGGEVVTVKCFEDNSRVKEHLATDGKGKVLVVDGGGSLRNALIGDMIAENAVKNIDITFGGVTFHPGEYVYADNNGIITSRHALL